MNLPKELEPLRNRKIWLCYPLIWNDKKHNGVGGYDKPPVNPYTLRDGSSTDSARWATFDECNAQIGKPATVFYKNKEYITQPVAGVGLVLEAAGILGIDFDHVIKRDSDGKVVAISKEAQKIWQYVDSYTEVSVSGTGVHILVVGKKPDKEVCRVANDDGTEYEMYDSGRYFTLSGNALKGCGKIAQRDEQVKKVYDFILQRRQEQAAARSSVVSCTSTGGRGLRVSPDESDHELWAKMFNSRYGAQIKALYDGDTSSFGGDESRADLALCNHLAYWTNNDESRIDKMFRESGLMRKKWERADYRARTISLALKDKSTYHEYTPEEKKRYAQMKEKQERAAGTYGSFLRDKAKKRGGKNG